MKGGRTDQTKPLFLPASPLREIDLQRDGSSTRVSAESRFVTAGTQPMAPSWGLGSICGSATNLTLVALPSSGEGDGKVW